MAKTRTKAELLEALRESERDVLEKLGVLPAERFEQGRYENGWNGREILAHAAAIEWTYPRLVDIARDGARAHENGPEDGRRTDEQHPNGAPTKPVKGGIDSYNDRQAGKRAEASVAELLEEFKKNRGATIAAVEAAEEDLFGKEIRSAGGITGTLANVIYAIGVAHVRGHMNDIIGTD